MQVELSSWSSVRRIKGHNQQEEQPADGGTCMQHLIYAHTPTCCLGLLQTNNISFQTVQESSQVLPTVFQDCPQPVNIPGHDSHALSGYLSVRNVFITRTASISEDYGEFTGKGGKIQTYLEKLCCRESA